MQAETSSMVGARPPSQSGIFSSVYSLLVSGKDLYAGGNFGVAGGKNANGVSVCGQNQAGVCG